MKKAINGFFLAAVFLFAGSFVSNAQVVDKVTGAVKTGADKTVSGTKTGWRRGKRIGHTIGNRTWTGSKWVASNSWRGGKWVARKTKNGTKWVYYKATGRGAKRKL
ncbi:MAG: hypothetical protein WBD16_00075 [Pyrinomonadaceae bacterium]